MKITNNEIMVELPELKPATLINPMTNRRVKAPPFTHGYNIAIKKAAELNPPRVVDVEALANLIYSSGKDFNFSDIGQYSSVDDLMEKIRKGSAKFKAQHLASDLDKWLKEKKEDRTL